MKRILLAAVLAIGLVGCVCNEKKCGSKCNKSEVSACAKAKGKCPKTCPEGCTCAKCEAKKAAETPKCLLSQPASCSK